IDNQIKVLFPKENIQLSQVSGSVVISGSVTNPQLATDVQLIVEAAIGKDKVVNLLKKPTLDIAQVQLQIRVAEVNRQVLRELGASYGVFNSSFTGNLSPAGSAGSSGTSSS